MSFKDKNRLREYSREYYQNNRDKINEYYQKNREKIRQRKAKYHKKYYAKNRDKIIERTAAWQRWKNYKVTRDFIVNKPCEICGTTDFGKQGPCVDHDHECCPDKKTCGKCIRGVLCSHCNRMLGCAKDNAKILKQAIKYLAYHKK